AALRGSRTADTRRPAPAHTLRAGDLTCGARRKLAAWPSHAPEGGYAWGTGREPYSLRRRIVKATAGRILRRCRCGFAVRPPLTLCSANRTAHRTSGSEPVIDRQHEGTHAHTFRPGCGRGAGARTDARDRPVPGRCSGV